MIVPHYSVIWVIIGSCPLLEYRYCLRHNPIIIINRSTSVLWLCIVAGLCGAAITVCCIQPEAHLVLIRDEHRIGSFRLM